MYQVADRLTPDTYLRPRPRRRTPRWRWPASPASASSTTCTTRPGGTPLRRPQRHGRGPDRGRRRRRHPHHPARHRLPLLRLRTARALDQHQLRFSDGTADAWAERVSALSRTRDHARIGAAIHSVRAVPAGQLGDRRRLGRGAAGARSTSTSPSRPPRTTPAADAHGCTPTQLLADHGVLGPAHHRRPRHPPHRRGHRAARRHRHRRVHVPHHRTRPRRRHRPGRPRSRRAGCPLSLGSDSHAVIDLLEEARAHGAGRAAAHPHPRPLDGRRRCCAPPPPTATPPWAGPTRARLEPGALADFTTVALDSVRTAGPLPRLGAETAVFAATAADVRHTVVGGRHVVRDGVARPRPGRAARALRGRRRSPAPR